MSASSDTTDAAVVATMNNNNNENTTSTTTTRNPLSARELEWAVNPESLLQQHERINGKIVRTRFPPEPNGYLHIGHAKSMNMNFRLAFDKLQVPMEHRRTIFRYDDTNPDAETKEYIDSLAKDVEWLGWTPEKTTYSSDYFPQLYEYAIVLIQKGLAYVCDMTKAEMEIQRKLALDRVQAKNSGQDPDVVAPIPSSDVLPGRNRNTSVQRNLDLFLKMKMGLFQEGQYTLRLKMDMTSSNPNMYDLVAYRIKYTSHPHAGKGWCIYPAYDFTHGICDSLEHVDYSICTLEFETRREPYYWILWALDLYRPNVYEMSRLNVQYTVLSKRRLLKLVQQHFVRGWDDPRMPTISGLRRRGYNADIVNTFCQDVGATRAMNVVEMNKLQQTARLILANTAPRAMAALDPIRIDITNWNDILSSSTGGGENDNNAMNNQFMTFEVQNIATDPSLGSHTITMTSTIYIDSTDFRLEDSSTYYGLAPHKAVGLKYQGGNLICDEVIMDETTNNKNKVVALKCRLDNSEHRIRPKTYISWVPSNGIPCQIRVYNHLFTVPEPTDQWEEELNPQSEMVYPHAMIDPSVRDIVDAKHIDQWKSTPAFQLERIGYFCVDLDTTYDAITNSGLLVLNRTVSLKEEVFKKQLSQQEQDAVEARKLKAKLALQAKEVRMALDPMDLFRCGEEYQGLYSQFDPHTGIPTHDAQGKELTKSAMKNLKKEQDKHKNAQMKWNKDKNTK